MGESLYKIKSKPIFIPVYKIKEIALKHLKIKSKVYALVITFIDMNKAKEIREYTEKEFDSFKDTDDFSHTFIVDVGKSSNSEVEGTLTDNAEGEDIVHPSP